MLSDNNEETKSSASKAGRRSRAFKPGQSRFFCDYVNCHASFTRLEHLKRHNVIHERSVSFECSFCKQSFLRRDILKRHIIRQHPNQAPNDISDERIRMASYPYSKRSQSPRDISPHNNILSEEPPSVVMEDQSHDSEIIIAAKQPRYDPVGGSEGQIQGHTTRHSFSSDDVITSPQAILANSNQTMSNLLNDEFLTWLFDTTSSDMGSCFNHSEQSDIIAEATVDDTAIQRNLLSPDIIIDSPLPTQPHSVSGFVPDSPLICSEETSQRIMDFINLASFPLVERFINPSYITFAVEVYWSVHARWPILHKPSFIINLCPTYLLVAMITLAMHISGDDDARIFAIKIHETFRLSVYALPEFKTPASLSVFQALLLSEIFEKMASTKEQHEMATIFHDVLISSMRRGGTMGKEASLDSDYQRGTEIPVIEESDLHKQWREFILEESSKRIAFFAFVMNCQHAFFFDHAPSVLISDLPFRLPCEESLWEAPTASEWSKLRNMFPKPPYFMGMLKTFLSQQAASPSLSPWSMMIMLHGLMSVGWTMSRREAVISEEGMDVVLKAKDSVNDTPRRGQEWLEIVSNSFLGWLRTYRIMFIMNGKLPFNHPYVLGCLTTYEFAHMALHTDLQSLQTFAAGVALARKSSPSRRKLTSLLSSERSVYDWSVSQRSSEAIVHALDLIDMFLASDKEYDAACETAFHRPWCLYLAVLTVWVFSYLSTIVDMAECLDSDESTGDSSCEDRSKGETSSALSDRRPTKGRLNQFLVQMRSGALGSSGLRLRPKSRQLQSKQLSRPVSRFFPSSRPSNSIPCDADVLIAIVGDLLKSSQWKYLRDAIGVLDALVNRGI